MKTLRTIQKSHLAMDFIALLAGGVLPLAFAPLNFFPLAFLCPLLLLISLQGCSVPRAIWRGWLFGAASFAVGASWIYVSIHTFGNTSMLLAVLITAGFVALLGIFFALMTACYVIFFANKSSTFTQVLGFACCWVLQEVLRSWTLTGFPWLLLGTTQITTFLAGYAPIVSVYGVSFLVVLLSGLLFSLLKSKRSALVSGMLIIAIFLLGWSLANIQWSKPISHPLRVSLIQGNIPQSVKWNPVYLQASLQRYQELTEKNLASDLIIWPEGAVPDLLTNQPRFLTHIDDIAKRHHTAVITGIPLSDPTQQFFYNGAITLGDSYGVYLKRHLVPFGEYVPFEQWLRGLIGFFNLPMSNFSPGPFTQTLIRVDGIHIATYLCYEIAYLNLVLNEQPLADVLLNISDDSWFGESWAAAQQLQIAQMRSLETAREQLVVANNGYTAIINTHGQISAIAPRDKTFVLHGIVQGYQGKTMLVRIGWLIEFIVLVLLTTSCGFFNYYKKRK